MLLGFEFAVGHTGSSSAMHGDAYSGSEGDAALFDNDGMYDKDLGLALSNSTVHVAI
jgi:hypothetical protein